MPHYTWQMKTVCVQKFAQNIKHAISSSTWWNYSMKLKKSKCAHRTQCEPYPNTQQRNSYTKPRKIPKKWVHGYLWTIQVQDRKETWHWKLWRTHANMATLQNYRGLCHINSQASTRGSNFRRGKAHDRVLVTKAQMKCTKCMSNEGVCLIS